MKKSINRRWSRVLLTLLCVALALPSAGITGFAVTQVDNSSQGLAAAEQYGVTAFYTDYKERGSATTMVATVTNGSDTLLSGNFVLAIYKNDDKRTVYSEAKPFTAPAGGKLTAEFTVNLNDYPYGDYTYSSFCWDENLVPVDKADSTAPDFELVKSGVAADVYVDSADLPGVMHAADNLSGDIEAVTGISASLKDSPEGLSQYAVIAGSIGKSPVIDKLIVEGKIDVSQVEGKWEAYTITTVNQPVPGVKRALVVAGSDMRGAVYGVYKISETIGVSAWGFFADSVPAHQGELSLPPETIVQGEPSVKYRGIFINDERSLDRWMNQFAAANNHTVPYYQSGSQMSYRLTHEFYVEVFDMILRQNGNYLWPAMWNNSFWVDDPLNGKLATDYGIVIGTTHQEFMNCPDKEWVWNGIGADGSKGAGNPFQWIDPNYPDPAEWRYVNKTGMIAKWTETMEATKQYETIVNMGLRGLNDVAIFPQGTKEQNILLLNDVINEQRKIIEKVHGTTDIPQSVIIYKEVESFYYGDDAADPNSGWKASIADDITTILCDDNHGNVRGLPMDLNRNRSGGFGMYYHFDYNGSPRSFRWMDSTPSEKIREQMMMAYDYGVDRIWVTNVGDLKFNEAPIDYWFKLAYDVEKWGGTDGPDKAHKEFAAREFGEELADDIADVIAGYTYMNNVRKPEILLANTLSYTYFNESETWLAKYDALADKALEIKKQIPPERMDAYYNLVLQPTLTSANAWRLMINLQKNQVYQAHGLPIANDYAEIARACLLYDNFYMHQTYGKPGLIYPNYASDVAAIKRWLGDDVIDADENTYYCVGEGKYYGWYPRRNTTAPYNVVSDESIYYLGLTEWNHRTAQFAFTTVNWDDIPNPWAWLEDMFPDMFPPGTFPPTPGGPRWTDIYDVEPSENPSMVVIPQTWVDASLVTATTGSVTLPKFTSYGDEKWHIDVANTSLTPFAYTAAASDEWIVLDKASGTSNKIDRINVGIDWAKVPAGAAASGYITIKGAGETVTVTVSAEVFNTSQLPDKTFVETNGYISILSKDYAKSVPAAKNGVTYQWSELPDYGRELSSMKVMPTALDAGYNSGRIPGVDSPYLEYNVYIKTQGQIDIITQWAPTNGMDPRQLTTLNYGVQLGDEETPQIVNSLSRNYLVTNNGGIMWADGVESATRTITLRNNGIRNMSRHTVSEPGVYKLRIYMVSDGLTLQKILVGTSTLARMTVAAVTNQTDTMNASRVDFPEYTTPAILTGQRDGANTNNAPGTFTEPNVPYFGPPESFFTKTVPILKTV